MNLRGVSMKSAGSLVYKFLLVATVLCWTALSHSKEDRLIIGVMSCLTGDCAEWGTNSRKGVELAIEQINAQGGVLGQQISAVFEDSQDTNPSRTVSAFQQLITNKKINFIVGPNWTVGGMSVAPLIARNKNLIVISPSVGVRDFNETSDNIFNTWPHDEKATRALARYAMKNSWKTAAIFGSQDPWVETQSKIFKEEYTNLGGAITAEASPLPSSRELHTEALKIKNSKPDVVFFANYQADVIAKEFSALGFSAPKLSILMEKERVKAAQGALEGTVFALYEAPSQAFSKAFQAKFKAAPGITADTAYDALMILVEGIKQANSLDLERVKEKMHHLAQFPGASGTFSVDETGGVDKMPVLCKVEGEEYVRLERAD